MKKGIDNRINHAYNLNSNNYEEDRTPCSLIHMSIGEEIRGMERKLSNESTYSYPHS